MNTGTFRWIPEPDVSGSLDQGLDLPLVLDPVPDLRGAADCQIGGGTTGVFNAQNCNELLTRIHDGLSDTAEDVQDFVLCDVPEGVPRPPLCDEVTAALLALDAAVETCEGLQAYVSIRQVRQRVRFEPYSEPACSKVLGGTPADDGFTESFLGGRAYDTGCLRVRPHFSLEFTRELFVEGSAPDALDSTEADVSLGVDLQCAPSFNTTCAALNGLAAIVPELPSCHDIIKDKAGDELPRIVRQTIGGELDGAIAPLVTYEGDRILPPDEPVIDASDLLDTPGATTTWIPAALTRHVYGWFANPFGDGQTYDYQVKDVKSFDVCPDGTRSAFRIDGGALGLWCGTFSCPPGGPSFCPPEDQVLDAWVQPATSGPTLSFDFWVDPDRDGLPSEVDNCPDVPNGDQQDTDGDRVGDACDGCPGDPTLAREFSTDSDGDMIADECDNCPSTQNAGPGFTQTDVDGDGLGDACDLCPNSDQTGKSDLTCCTLDLDCGQGFGGCVPLQPGNNFGCAVGVCGRTADGDFDGVGAFCDNCPGTYNRDQLDTDGDGIGDRCDLCAGLHNYPEQPTDADREVVECEYRRFGRLDDLNCQQETGDPRSHCAPPPTLSPGASEPLSGRCTYGRDADGDGQGDACDGCPNDADVSSDGPGNNCNYIAEVVRGVPYPLPSDACDPTPCARFEDYSATKVVDPNGIPWDGFGFRATTLPLRHPNAYPYALPLGNLPPGERPSANVGVRACSCDLASALACRNECPMDNEDLYEFSERWTVAHVTPMAGSDLPGVPTVPSGGFLPNGEVSPVELFSANRDPAFSDPALPNPSVGVDPAELTHLAWYMDNVDVGELKPSPEFVGIPGFGFQGVVWLHVPMVDGIQSNLESEYRQVSSQFAWTMAGRLPRELPVLGELPVAVCGPFCVDFCTRCTFERFSPSIYINPVDAGVSVGADEWRESLTPKLPEPVVNALVNGGDIRLFASEPEVGFNAPAYAALTDVGGLRTAVFRTTSGFAASTASVAPSAPIQGFSAVLSATEGTVYLIGGTRDGSAHDLTAMDAQSGEQLDFNLGSFGGFGTILAATYRPEDRALYVIDEVWPKWWLRKARLLWISVQEQSVSVLGSWPRLGLTDKLFLSNGHDGTLLVSGSSSWAGAHAVVGLGDDGGALAPVWSRLGPGQLVHAPTLSRFGLTRLVERQGDEIHRFTSYDRLKRRLGGSVASCVR